MSVRAAHVRLDLARVGCVHLDWGVSQFASEVDRVHVDSGLGCGVGRGAPDGEGQAWVSSIRRVSFNRKKGFTKNRVWEEWPGRYGHGSLKRGEVR